MNRQGFIRTSVCALLAVIAGLTALTTGAFAENSSTADHGVANALRSGSGLPKLEERHAVAGAKQKSKKAHRQHGKRQKGSKGTSGNGTTTGTPGSSSGGGQTETGGGSSTPTN